MTYWAEVLPNGRVYSCGSVPESITPQPVQGGVMVQVDAQYNPDEIAVYDGKVLLLGSAPSPDHRFNFAQKAWSDPRTLTQLKLLKWQEIKRARARAEQGPFNAGGAKFDGDTESMRVLSSLVTEAKEAILAGTAYSAEYVLFNETVVTLTAVQLVGLEKAKNRDVFAINAKAVQLRKAIIAAANKTAVDAITWNQNP